MAGKGLNLKNWNILSNYINTFVFYGFIYQDINSWNLTVKDELEAFLNCYFTFITNFYYCLNLINTRVNITIGLKFEKSSLLKIGIILKYINI